MKTTPRPPLDITAFFPELVPLARQAVRLHPRRGPEPGFRESKLGGTFLWPMNEPWPFCPVGHGESEPQRTNDAKLLCEEAEWRSILKSQPAMRVAGQPHDAYVGIIQLRAADAPELGFPEGYDLFQLLWCPRDHLKHYGPQCRVYWRQTSAISSILTDILVPSVFEPHYLPHICVFTPERIREYLAIGDLPEEMQQRIWEWEDTDAAQGYSYQYHLSVAPGTKIGGYVQWVQDPEIPVCTSCQHEMEHLLTIDSLEWDGESWRTWQPLEERHLTFDDASLVDQRRATQGSTGLVLGDANRLVVFICRSCPGWPTASIHQSS